MFVSTNRVEHSEILSGCVRDVHVARDGPKRPGRWDALDRAIQKMANETTTAGPHNSGGTIDAPCISFDARETLQGAYDDATTAQLREVGR